MNNDNATPQASVHVLHQKQSVLGRSIGFVLNKYIAPKKIVRPSSAMRKSKVEKL